MTVGSGTRLRIIVLMAVLSVAFLTLVARLFYWQVVERNDLLRQAEREHQGAEPVKIRAQRGLIYDREGFLLAGNVVTCDVVASPDTMKDDDFRREVVGYIAPAIGKSSDDILDNLRDVTKPYVYIAFQVSQADCDEVRGVIDREDLGHIIKVEPHALRVYPEGSLAAHLLGFVNSDKAGYKGVYGVEARYDAALRGVDGEGLAERDPGGSALPIVFAEYRRPADGKNLYLTIERTAQYIVERELEDAVNKYHAESGTVVVLQPRTGAVLSMASWPCYDPNRYADADSDIFTDPAISVVYEPGSVFKIVTLAAALNSETVTPETILNDSGAVEVGGNLITNRDEPANGPVDMLTALGKSLNVVFAQIAAMLGQDQFYNYAQRFGFGSLTQVDLAAETSGILKTPDDPAWSESDLGANSFGQAIDATPLQVASAVAAIANGGLLMRPYIVYAVDDGNGPVLTQPKPERRAVLPQTAHTLTNMLEQVVEQYTTLAQVPGYRVAGKSGTSQVYMMGGYHPTLTVASFVGYLPADDPEVLILVVIKRPKESPWGGKVAAPVFARIAQQMMVLLNVPPDAVRRQAASQPVSWQAQ